MVSIPQGFSVGYKNLFFWDKPTQTHAVSGFAPLLAKKTFALKT